MNKDTIEQLTKMGRKFIQLVNQIGRGAATQLPAGLLGGAAVGGDDCGGSVEGLGALPSVGNCAEQ